MAFLREVGAPDCEDALMDTPKPSRAHAVTDRRMGEPGRSHLRAGDDPVLPRDDRPNLGVGSGNRRHSVD
jgi:hypothetical protein